MDQTVTTCALLGRFEDSGVAEAAAALLPALAQRGLVTLVQNSADWQRFADQVQAVDDAQLLERAQLGIVIGGDGSLLYAARLVAQAGIPLLGINRGRLGFLTDVMPQDMLDSLDAALQGRCSVDKRPLLDARILSPNRQPPRQLALNDVVLSKWDTGRILDFETSIDGSFLNSHGGDGLVVASATGSTAYALSCGGPIVAPDLDVLVMVPICPHTLSDRPIVVSRHSRIAVTLHERAGTRAQVTCDGVICDELLPGEQLLITPAIEQLTLLHPPGYDYFRLLRAKLHWGRAGLDHQR
ncbi:MAG: NAD(+)/NADH kinase [Proteobacteria bacterium]|nr:NAD(+)/NADH kinase [Pseudomonadota bacterium]